MNSSFDIKSEVGTASDSPCAEGVFIPLTRFMRHFWLRCFGISLIVLIPCIWHRRIEAGDLNSHIYNAWLTQLIESGKAPGLWIAHQPTNVLFDFMLVTLSRIIPLLLAAKIIVAISVLLFFWSTFAFIASITDRAPWTLCTFLAMVCYGWTFNMGFLNYYLSLGLSFLGIAVIWKAKKWEFVLLPVVLFLILMAHPLGLAWFVSASAFLLAFRHLAKRFRAFPFITAVLCLIAIHFYFWKHFVVSSKKHSFYLYNGTDQFVLNGPAFKLSAVAMAGVLIAVVAFDFVKRNETSKNFGLLWSMLLQLYILVFLAITLLPDSIRFLPSPAPLSLLSARLTSISAILLCCIAGMVLPRRWHCIVFAAPASLFFCLLYLETSRINRIEDQADRLIAGLPPFQRVLVTIPDERNSRLTLEHIVDTACIYHCFTYGNYEASSGQFRVRALPGNSFVTSDYSASADISAGTYMQKPSEMPMYQIFVCGLENSEEKLCLRLVSATETSGPSDNHQRTPTDSQPGRRLGNN